MGTTRCPCPLLSGCLGRLSGVLSAGSDTENTGESCSGSLLRELVVGERELDAEERTSTAHRRASPHPSRSLARTLGNLKTDSQLAVLPPPSSPQKRLRRLSSFSLNSPTPRHNPISPSIYTVVSSTAHRQGNTVFCIGNCPAIPFLPIIVLFLCPGNKINYQNWSKPPSEMFSTRQNESVLLGVFEGVAPFHACSRRALEEPLRFSCRLGNPSPSLWRPFSLPFTCLTDMSETKRHINQTKFSILLKQNASLDPS